MDRNDRETRHYTERFYFFSLHAPMVRSARLQMRVVVDAGLPFNQRAQTPRTHSG